MENCTKIASSNTGALCQQSRLPVAVWLTNSWIRWPAFYGQRLCDIKYLHVRQKSVVYRYGDTCWFSASHVAVKRILQNREGGRYSGPMGKLVWGGGGVRIWPLGWIQTPVLRPWSPNLGCSGLCLRFCWCRSEQPYRDGWGLAWGNPLAPRWTPGAAKPALDTTQASQLACSNVGYNWAISPWVENGHVFIERQVKAVNWITDPLTYFQNVLRQSICPQLIRAKFPWFCVNCITCLFRDTYQCTSICRGVYFC